MTTLEVTEKAQPKTKIKREYYKWFSPNLERDMEFLVFGHEGIPIVFFPTRMARFFDYEDWGVITALKDKITAGAIQLYCVDSADDQSFYCKSLRPEERIRRHARYENYILYEILPFIRKNNPHKELISAGCSLGAYHAVNIAFRYPHLFSKVIGMSGRYDLTLRLEYFQDLFEGYWDENIYFNMPSQYIPNLVDPQIIPALQKMEIIFAIGVEDAFLDNNILMNHSLREKNITNTMDLWQGEAHKARYWGEMLQIYL